MSTVVDLLSSLELPMLVSMQDIFEQLRSALSEHCLEAITDKHLFSTVTGVALPLLSVRSWTKPNVLRCGLPCADMMQMPSALPQHRVRICARRPPLAHPPHRRPRRACKPSPAPFAVRTPLPTASPPANPCRSARFHPAVGILNENPSIPDAFGKKDSWQGLLSVTAVNDACQRLHALLRCALLRYAALL